MSHEQKSPSLVIGSEEWVESFPDGLYDLAMALVLQSVEQVERVDPINRKLIWDDGKALSIDESIQRIAASHPALPAELIRVHLIGWLEMDELVSAWADELDGFQ